MRIRAILKRIAGNRESAEETGPAANPLVSVVVPIHNCADYIEDLLISLQQQSYSTFEVVCVDDASTDDTLEIVTRFCATDQRFRFVAKEHSGAGPTRNAGMDEACGDYLIFLDADDEYKPVLLERMVSALEESGSDIAICMFSQIDRILGKELENRGLYGQLRDATGCVSPLDVADLFLTTSPNPINKMYRMSYLRSVGLRYTAGKIAQDLTFTFSALSTARSIMPVHETLAVVHTGKDGDSISSGRAKYASDALFALRELYRWLSAHDVADRFESSFVRRGLEVFKYESNFAFNEGFVREMADMLTNELPWSGLPAGFIQASVSSDLKSLEKKVRILEKRKASHEGGEETEQRLIAARNQRDSMRMLHEQLERHSE